MISLHVVVHPAPKRLCSLEHGDGPVEASAPATLILQCTLGGGVCQHPRQRWGQWCRVGH
eukprot:5769148-Pleurochrysis_carterae.AAC.1